MPLCGAKVEHFSCFHSSCQLGLKIDNIGIPIKTFQRRTKYPYLYFLRRDLQFFTFFKVRSLADVGLLLL